jgi:hypothetical protein
VYTTQSTWIVRVIELRPKQITEVSTSPGGFTQTTRDYAIGDLDNELALMAMLRAPPARNARTSSRRSHQHRGRVPGQAD